VQKRNPLATNLWQLAQTEVVIVVSSFDWCSWLETP